MNDCSDTIVSISTPVGRGAISIVRISGDKSFSICEKIFKPINKKDRRGFSLSYGHLTDGGEVIDEVLVSFMKSPKSYTKEDMIEINCHGGTMLTRRVLDLVIKYGARLAEAGEFTKRAFMSGRIDLTQAESILDIINASSEKSISNSLKNMDGFLKDRVKEIKSKILGVLANINVVSDYPEEVDDFVVSQALDELKEVQENLKAVLNSYETGKKIKDGARVAIVGKPNVGKSSIMNRLLKSDRAIVTNIPGTTRDVLEDTFYLDGLPVVILDTAGIRESKDRVEKIGIDLSLKTIESADLILFVVDSSSNLDTKDEYILNKIKDKNILIVLNKSDLNKKANLDGISISAKDDLDFLELEKQIYDKTYGSLNIGDGFYIDNLRHKELFSKTEESINQFIENVGKAPLDIISIYLNAALTSLGEIIGEITNEDLLDNIFSNFCVGK